MPLGAVTRMRGAWAEMGVDSSSWRARRSVTDADPRSDALPGEGGEPTPDATTRTSDAFLPMTVPRAWIIAAKHTGAAMHAEASAPATAKLIVTKVTTIEVDGVGDGDVDAVAEREGDDEGPAGATP